MKTKALVNIAGALVIVGLIGLQGFNVYSARKDAEMKQETVSAIHRSYPVMRTRGHKRGRRLKTFDAMYRLQTSHWW